MAAVDFFEIAIEESPLNENTFALATTPNRVSTNKFYPPARTGRIAPSPQHLSRADELRGITGEVPRLIDTYEPAGVLTSRAYADLLTYLLLLSGFQYVYTAGGALVSDPNTTTVTGVNALNSATVNVADASAFPAAGVFILAGTTAVTYTGRTATSFTGCGNHPATTGGETITGNVPTGANKWVFTKRDAIDARTAKIRANYASEGVLLEGYGFGVSSLALPATGEISADWMGLFMRRLAVDTTTVPALQASSIAPFRRGELYVSAIAGGGRLGDFNVNITNPLARIKSLSQSPQSDWPDALEYGDEQVGVGGSIPKRILAAADYDALQNASTFALLARWMSKVNIGATAKAYGLWVDCPKTQVVGGEPDELGGNKRRYGMNLDWFASYDETAGYDAKITLVNGTTSAMETYV